MEGVPTNLFDFGWFSKTDYTFNDYIKELAAKAIPEYWGEDNKILKNYFSFTFQYLAENYNANPENNYIVFSRDNSAAAFNTGLFDEDYESIFAFFKKNYKQNSQPWFFIGFKTSSDIEMNSFSDLPKRNNYFKNPEELILNPEAEIRINIPHILRDDKNRSRLPRKIQKYSDPMIKALLEGAVTRAKRKVSANYTIAVPQFYQRQLQLLLPLELQGNGTPDLALAISFKDGVYSGRTALTLEMAYNNARLITKPETSWVQPIV